MRAIAKTNLFLRIVGKRSDSYHELENVFVPLHEIYDDVQLVSGTGKGISLSVTGRGLVADQSNLCLRAADAFCEAAGVKPNVEICLEKRIPIAAGLGGGSSDAAAVLLLLNDYCGKQLGADELHTLAAGLGADVPYFLNPVPALGTGRGDVLSPLELNGRFAVILAAPCFPLSVVWTFSHLQPPASTAPRLEDFLAAARSGEIADIAAACRNDLEAAVFMKFPLLCAMRDCMLENGALTVHVSGSGPSLYALVEIEDAKQVAEAYSRMFSGFLPPFISVFGL